VLREIEGWSYKQLASALKRVSATVMSRLSQARRRLRKKLREFNVSSYMMNCEEVDWLIREFYLIHQPRPIDSCTPRWRAARLMLHPHG